ncbi:CBS domain-containing protein [Acidisoma sp. 7E03]
MSIERILRGKSRDIASTTGGATLAAVCTLLADRRIGAVPVLEGNALVGIISERDVVRALARGGATALELPVSEIMTRAVRTITRLTTVEEAMAIMTEGRFRHLPVVEEGQMVGIVSIGDVVKARLVAQQMEVEELKSYVAGAV